MDDLTSPAGALALAVSALLLVLGFRLARPGGTREWMAVGAYAAALVTQVLGARGLLPGTVVSAGVAVRMAGAVLLVFGLVLAGRSARERRRAVMGGVTPPPSGARSADRVHVGLALVVLGQLLRAPSVAGTVAALVAVGINAWLGLKPQRNVRPLGPARHG